MSGLLLFIRGFLDVAALWRGVIDRLALPGWESVPVTLRGTGRAEPSRRGPVLVANGDDDRPHGHERTDRKNSL